MNLFTTLSLLALLLAGSAALQGCGQTGPLYQPPPDSGVEADENG